MADNVIIPWLRMGAAASGRVLLVEALVGARVSDSADEL